MSALRERVLRVMRLRGFSPRTVQNYLGRYSHKVAISDHRILSLENGIVTYTWHDRDDGNKEKTDRLPVEEFTRRFCYHILPPGFQKIRYYGWLSAAKRQSNPHSALPLQPAAPSNTFYRQKRRGNPLTTPTQTVYPRLTRHKTLFVGASKKGEQSDKESIHCICVNRVVYGNSIHTPCRGKKRCAEYRYAKRTGQTCLGSRSQSNQDQISFATPREKGIH